MSTPNLCKTINPDLFSNSFGFLLVKNTLIFEKLADIKLAPLDITSSQMRVFMMIGYAGFTMASTIAKKMGSNAGGVVRSIDRLEAKGWIERIRSVEDRREVHLNLTAQGRKLIEQIPLVLQESNSLALKGFSDDEERSLINLLERLAQNNLEQLAQHEVEDQS